MLILLAALALNLLLQNTVMITAILLLLVKLAAILLQRKTVKLAAIALAGNIYVAVCFGFNLVIAHKKMTINATITSFRCPFDQSSTIKFQESGNVCRHFIFYYFFLLIFFFFFLLLLLSLFLYSQTSIKAPPLGVS